MLDSKVLEQFYPSVWMDIALCVSVFALVEVWTLRLGAGYAIMAAVLHPLIMIE